MATEAHDVILRYVDTKSQRSEWIQEADTDHRFRVGIQYTEDEIKELKRRGQAPIVINKLHAQVAHYVNLAMSYLPSPSVIPVSGGDADKAALHQRILRHILYRSNYSNVVRRVVIDQVTCGVGWFQAYVDENPVTGRPEIMVDYVPWYRVHPDPESIRPDLADAAYVFVANYLSRNRARVLFPEHAEMVDSIPSEQEDVPSSGVLGSEENIKLWKAITNSSADSILYLEEYYQKRVKRYLVTSLIPERPFTVIFDAEQLRQLREIVGMVENEQYVVAEIDVPAIFRRTVLGIDVLEDDLYYVWYDRNPLYPLVPAWFEHLGNTEPIGLVRFVRGQQQEYNKLHMLTVANATASTGVRLLAPENSIDPDTIEVALSKPVGVITYNPTLGEKPVPLVVQPLTSGIFALMADLKRDMEYSGGATDIALGTPTRLPRTGMATLALEEWSRRRALPVIHEIADAVKRLGRVLVRMVQTYYSSAQVVRIVNPEKPEEIEEQVINLPIYDKVKGTVIDRFNDVSVGVYDVHVDINRLSFSSRQAEAQWYAQLYQIGLIDDIALLQKLDIENKDEIIKRKSLLAQLQQGIRELAEYAKMLEQKNKIVENQLISAQIRSKILELASRIELDQEKQRIKVERQLEDVTSQLAKAAQEFTEGGENGG